MAVQRSAEWMRQRHRRVLRGLRLVFGLQLMFSVGAVLVHHILQQTPPSPFILGSGLVVALMLLPQARRWLKWMYLPILLVIDLLHITALLWTTPLEALQRGSLWALAYIPILVAAGRWWSYSGGAITLGIVLTSNAWVLFSRLPWREALPVMIFQAVTATLGVWAAALTEARTRRDLLQQEAHRVTVRHLRELRSLADQSARQLHDLGHVLHEIDESLPNDPSHAARLTATASDVVRNALRRLQRTLRTSDPAPLQQRTLPEIIASELRNLQSEYQISHTFYCDGHLPTLSPAIADYMLRASQALLHNVLSHSDATAITVDLHGDGNRVLLRVHDNGIGIREIPKSDSSLASLREQANDFGGSIDIDTGNGTAITISVPASAPFAIAHDLQSAKRT